MRYALGFLIGNKVPPVIKDAISWILRPVPRPFLLGRGFRSKLRELQASDMASRQELEEGQLTRLKKLIAHAGSRVPIHRDLVKHSVRSLDDLDKLPPLTKQSIRSNPEAHCATNSYQFGPGKGMTSGSTGQPLHFLIDQETREYEYAALWRAISWYGIRDTNARIASIRGELVHETSSRGRLGVWNGITHEYQVNSYHVSAANTRALVESLDRFRPDIIRGFPHSLYMLARFGASQNIELRHRPKLLLVSSEKLTIEMEEVITQWFGAPVLDWYSQSEYVAPMARCPEGNFHLAMEKSVLRFGDGDHSSLSLATSLTNYSMPFINYDVGDRFTPLRGSCPCGRNHAAYSSVDGRDNDMLVTNDGRVISGTGFDHYWKHTVTPSLQQVPLFIQVVQLDRSRAVINYSAPQPWSPQDETVAIQGLRHLLGSEADIGLNHSSQAPATHKWRLLESKVKA